MDSCLRALRSPGAMHAVSGIAPTQWTDAMHHKTYPTTDIQSNISGASGYTPKKKTGILDRGLDRIVRVSGSAGVFLCIQTALVTWAFLGIPFHDSQLWPIFISDAQAIFSYMFDSLLMRQQLNGYRESLTIVAELQSRAHSNRRMLWKVEACLGSDTRSVYRLTHNMVPVRIKLPREGWFTKIVSWMSMALGHILFVAAYWAGILLWLAFGRSNEWSDQWQLYINSSTSALMIFIFSFLAILRERHADYMRSCVDAIYRVDATLELKLRRLTGDSIENDEFTIHAAKVNPVQRAINYYADLVGTLVGVAILIAAIVVWIAIGPALHFSSNWWLLIGTYAGLVGLNDGFVLRNVQARLRDHEVPHYADLATEDSALLAALQIRIPPSSLHSSEKQTLSHRISVTMTGICAHEVTVILGVLLIFGLLIGASVMRWSETGQLLCNIPPSIVESFFMIILITGHNAADAQRRDDLRMVFERRVKLLKFASAAEMVSERRTEHNG